MKTLQIFPIFTLIILLALPVWAQNAAAPKTEGAPEEAAPITLTIPYNREEARIVATREAPPGEIIGQQSYKIDKDFYYEFKIRTPDETVYEIDINADIGTVVSVKINALGPGAKLPPPVIVQQAAEVLAVDHVKKNTSGAHDPKLKSDEYTLVDEKMVYKMEIEKRNNFYEVLVDARNGKIISMKRQ